MKIEQQIPCPVCAAKIPFDVNQLLLSLNFDCPNCGVSIGLASDSMPIIEQVVQKFDGMLKHVNTNEHAD